MTFWPEGSKPFSPKFWREVRREKRRLKRDRKLGHGWIWMMSKNLGECFRCGDRTDRIVAGDDVRFVSSWEEFEDLRDRLLKEEEGR